MFKVKRYCVSIVEERVEKVDDSDNDSDGDRSLSS